MLMSMRAHWLSAALTIVSVIFTGIALFTCHWISITGSLVGIGLKVYTGLYQQSGCSMGMYGGTPAWVTISLILVAAAFGFQLVHLLFVAITSFYRHLHEHILKVDSMLLSLSAFLLIASVFIFSIGGAIYWNDTVYGWSFDYSWYLNIVAAIFAILATGPVGHALHQIRYHGDCHC